MPNRGATVALRRLMQWLEAFKPCFGHRAQVLALRRYVQGLLSDSPRKSMEAMLARVTDPGSYQAFQHFITNAPWDAERVWRRLRELISDREGVLILDATTFLKQGEASVGVGGQYCGLYKKILNCQVALTAALWTGHHAYLLGATLHLPAHWLTDVARTRARIPARVGYQAKWRQLLTLLRQVRASRFQITAVLADAQFGDMRAFRGLLHRLQLPYAVGVSTHVTAYVERPVQVARGTPHTRYGIPSHIQPRRIGDIVAAVGQDWQRVRWRNAPRGRLCEVTCVAVRVTPSVDQRHPRLAPDIWLLAERDFGPQHKLHYFFVNLPPTASLRQIVRLAHQRWAIEQQYQELKTELGIDHFEGRTYPGWHHHVVLAALAYNFLQTERRRMSGSLTFPAVHAIVQEIFTAYLFAQRPHYLRRIEALKSVQLRI